MVQRRLTRLPDWRERLTSALAPFYNAPFSWGTHDCALGLACTVVEALTGADLREGWPPYRTEAGALRALRKRGFSSLEEAVAAELPEALSKLSARTGDVALLKTEGSLGYALGVVNNSTLMVVGTDGLGHRDFHEAIKVYHVG